MYFTTVIRTHNSVKTTVIRSQKCHFRKLVLLRMIECIDKKEVYSVNLLDAVRFVHKAWEHVTEKAIRNCFRQSGIIQEEVSTEIECNIATTEEDEDNLPFLNGCRQLTVLILLHTIWMNSLVLMMT